MPGEDVGKPPASRSRRIAVASLFGVIVWVVQGFLPAPSSDYLIAVEACLLALSNLVVGKGGATYVGAVSGLLISVVKTAFFPLDLVFALLFGLVVDGLGLALHVKSGGEAKAGRLVAAMVVSTAAVGFSAYYVTAVATNLVPNDFFLDLSILIFGVISGAIGGYVAARIWNKNLRARFESQALAR
ncbi:MAG: hypothetical protein OK422_02300 [Thaumarchaeota archaeon]|nr:hypothetical protein [Nitrososphaerota archaeon]